ncbi:MAG: hypothetical protein K6F26_04785 [Lachnospiraceae bacterium]|nr:hypothetical protein [Lachnospiraceae bacterium]
MGHTKHWVAIKEPFFLTIESIEDEFRKAIESWNALPLPRYQQDDSADRIFDLEDTLFEKPVIGPILANAILFSTYDNDQESSNYLYDCFQAFMHNELYSRA